MFRGSGYAMGEIIFWMAAAALLGAAIGWMLRRWIGFRRVTRDHETALVAGREQREKLRGELVTCRAELVTQEARIETLEAEAATRRRERDERGAAAETARAERDEAQRRLAALREELAALRSPSSGEPEPAVEPERDRAVEGLALALERARQDRARLVAEVEELASLVADLEGRLAERDV